MAELSVCSYYNICKLNMDYNYTTKSWVYLFAGLDYWTGLTFEANLLIIHIVEWVL